jgi:AcrR family transcriptional regulator
VSRHPRRSRSGESPAQSLGVSKGGFYGYFRNRDALLIEMLGTWECAAARR